MARTVRVTRQDQGQAVAPDHVLEVVVTETIRAAVDQQRAKASQLLNTRGFPVRNLQSG